jgi:D-3-phosphoglycerate dehydrogenase
MSKGKVLITDDLHSLLKEGLIADGFEVDDRPDIAPEQVLAIINEYTGLVINSKVYAGAELLGKGSKLKFVCRAGSGLEVIDLPFSAAHNIAAFNSPEGNRNAVGEQALGMLLGLMNNIVIANSETKNNQWLREKNRGEELSGKTVALIAYGNTGEAFAKLLRGFDVQILAYDKYKQGFGNEYIKEATLQEIFEQADVLSLHLPLTAETEYMIDHPFLSSFKKPYWFINTSRGKVLRTADMLRAVEEGKIKGAALDVLENERLSSYTAEEQELYNRIASKPNIILTPHIAGWTHESKRKIAETLLKKIKSLDL